MDTKIVEFDSLKNCRVCLISECEMSSLFGAENNPSYNKMLTECANINVRENDGLPVVICRNCVQEMLQAHKFVVKCQETDRNLRLSVLRSLAEVKEGKETKEGDHDVNVLLSSVIVKEEPNIHLDFDDLDECKQEDDSEDNERDYKTKHIKKKRKIKRDSRIKKYKNRKTNDFPRKCSDCELILKCESAMIIHMRKHTNERPFQCADCGKCFKTKNTLKMHISRRHIPRDEGTTSSRNYTCATCDKMFFRKKDMDIHIRTHTGETPYCCTFCSKAFNQLSSLIRHTRIHTGERPYECKLCHKRFPSSSELSTHRRVHSNERKYTCPLCNTLFKSKNALRTHSLIHSNFRDFICDKCGMSFNKKGNLKSHYNRMHSARAGQCCVCNKKFSKLDVHMRTHTGETPFQCDLCNKKFSLKSRLLSHITYHKGLDKHACQLDGCTKKFPKQSMLIFHILKYHKKHTPYICKHCNRGFYRLSDLKRHLKLNHSDEPDIIQDIKDADLINKNN